MGCHPASDADLHKHREFFLYEKETRTARWRERGKIYQAFEIDQVRKLPVTEIVVCVCNSLDAAESFWAHQEKPFISDQT